MQFAPLPKKHCQNGKLLISQCTKVFRHSLLSNVIILSTFVQFLSKCVQFLATRCIYICEIIYLKIAQIMIYMKTMKRRVAPLQILKASFLVWVLFLGLPGFSIPGVSAQTNLSSSPFPTRINYD